MLNSTAITALNHLLATAPWARERLRPFAGRSAEISALPLQLSLTVDPEGYFIAAPHNPSPDVSVDLPFASFPKAIGGIEALMGDIRIAGNADFADALGFVLRKLRWDGEEALAQRVGDIAAHRINNTLHGLARWHIDSARNVVENLAEYFTEEQPLLTKRAAFEDFAADIAALRDDLARLEKRLGRLR